MPLEIGGVPARVSEAMLGEEVRVGSIAPSWAGHAHIGATELLVERTPTSGFAYVFDELAHFN